MNSIIRFEDYIQRSGEFMRFEKLLKQLEQNRKEEYEYSLGEIKQIANSILSQLDYYSGKGATPIVKIANEFDFKTYKQELTQGLSGDININGDTLERYGHDKVIIVNKEEELFHQRFVVAHELAHYLFEYIGNPEYRDPAIKFSDTYFKDKHETPQEKRANRFAAAILMPEELFVQQYNIAKRVESNRIFIILYLSKFFETTVDSIERRITEVLS